MARHIVHSRTNGLTNLIHELIDKLRIGNINERITGAWQTIESEQSRDPAVSAEYVLHVPG